MPSPLAARDERGPNGADFGPHTRFRSHLEQPRRFTSGDIDSRRKKVEANGPALRRSKTGSPRRCFRLIGRTVMRSPWCRRNKRVKHGLLQLRKRLLVERRINGEWISREMTTRWKMKRLKSSKDFYFLLIASWTHDFPFDKVLFN